MMIGDVEICKDFKTGTGKKEKVILPMRETFDMQSTGGYSANNWHEHNVRPEPTAVLTRGVSSEDGRQPTNKLNNGSEVIEA